MAETAKQKTWKDSVSSTEEGLSPDDKRKRYNTSISDSKLSSEPDDLIHLLNMAEVVMPKLDLVLEKLAKVESKLEELESYAKSVDAKVSSLQAKVDCFELFKKETDLAIRGIEDGMNFANAEREYCKKRLQEMQNQLGQLKDEKLYMEVYQRRENLRFFGIKKATTAQEDTKEVLVEILKTELGIEGVDDIEFQRIHQIGKQSSSDEKPQQIIARFLRYPDRETIMSNARKLKGKSFGISADLPKGIMERRKRKMQQYKEAKAEGKQAIFSKAEPDKLFSGGVKV